jgi:hypothetical protein
VTSDRVTDHQGRSRRRLRRTAGSRAVRAFGDRKDRKIRQGISKIIALAGGREAMGAGGMEGVVSTPKKKTASWALTPTGRFWVHLASWWVK